MNRILIVEDDVWVKDCYVDWLKSKGHDVVWAADSQQALDLLDGKFGLVLLDLFLPHSNGVQLLNTLASHSDLNKIPVVVLSTMPPNKDSLANYGVADVLDKTTITKNELLLAVENAIL
jgi:DNA-binding response OmpR family regulator